MAEENFECEKCGRSFDSKRGLSVHKSQSHEDESKQEDKETEEIAGKQPDNNSSGINIGVRQALLSVFILGLAVGFSGGMLASNLDGLTGSEDAAPSGNGDDSDSQVSGDSTKEVMTSIGASMGINEDELRSCIESSDGSEINNDRQEIASAAGDIGTPTFFVGNSEIGYAQITGAQPYSRMKSTIDQKIQEAESGETGVSDDEYSLESISLEGEPTMGDESAKVNFIEYSDFGCPWCAEWHGVDAIPQRPIDREESFRQVKSNYVDTGQVQFVFKDFPVPQLHPEAETAHKAANCVLENSPEDYWDFSQKIFEERDRW